MNEKTIGKVYGDMNANDYFVHLSKEFSYLKTKLNEWEEDDIFFKMETFADYTIDQIKSENKDEIKKCLDFQESKIDFADSLLLNAMTVSYCEAFLIGECGQQMDWVVDLMGPKFKKLYNDYAVYYNNL